MKSLVYTSYIKGPDHNIYGGNSLMTMVFLPFYLANSGKYSIIILRLVFSRFIHI